MKQVSFLLGLLAIVCTSCTDYYFEHAQPRGIPAGDQLPEAYTGIFVEESEDGVEYNDSIILAPGYLKMIERSEERCSLEQIESSDKVFIKGRRVHYQDDAGNKYVMPFTQEKDTISFLKIDKNISALSDSLVYKSYRGYHFVNRLEKGKGWEVTLLEKNRKGDIRFLSLTDDDEEKIKAITDINILKIGEDEYEILDPSRRELMKMVKQGLFRDEELTFEASMRVD